jgi:hypothetical protein
MIIYTEKKKSGHQRRGDRMDGIGKLLAWGDIV